MYILYRHKCTQSSKEYRYDENPELGFPLHDGRNEGKTIANSFQKKGKKNIKKTDFVETT